MSVLGIALILILYPWALEVTAARFPTKQDVGVKSREGHVPGTISFSPPGAVEGNHGIAALRFEQARAVQTRFVGAEGAVELLKYGQAFPAAMTSADFNEDGIPDLVCGYAGPRFGMVACYQGDPEAIWPSGQDRSTLRAPFSPEARVFELPGAPEFLGAGDFDNDGHWDLVAAADGVNRLYFLQGNGRGEFSAAKTIPLPGILTALVTGEINRADGLIDIAVGIIGPIGPQVLVFESPNGALYGCDMQESRTGPNRMSSPSNPVTQPQPELFSIPAPATALAVGQLDDGFENDLAIAAGTELVIVHGRDRRLSLDEIRQAQTPAASVERRPLPFQIKSLALGDFVEDPAHRTDIAILSEAGELHLLSRRRTPPGQSRTDPGSQRWDSREFVAGDHLPVTGVRLVRVHDSGLKTDDLLYLDRAGRRLKLLTTSSDQTIWKAEMPAPYAIDLAVPPAAVLPMRLNSDALSDLMILGEGQSEPLMARTTAAMTFTVTNTGDNGGVNPMAFAGTGTLRQAIVDSNNNPGADTIAFNIPGAGPHTIMPQAQLTSVTDAVTIDGYTQPGASPNTHPLSQADNAVLKIELDGTNAGVNAIGLLIAGTNIVVRGLVINRFGGDGIHLREGGGNFVEGNFIGTNVAGSASLHNVGSGVYITLDTNETIGGTTAAARNLLSGNMGQGVFIVGSAASGHQVYGNFIGVDVTGMSDLGNAGTGVGVSDSPMNKIGSTIAGAGNVISGNNFSGVEIFDANAVGNFVQGNLIGTNLTGTAGIGNKNGGVNIARTAGNTLGGTASGARNVISDNTIGVFLSEPGATNNLVQGNYIGTSSSGTVALGNSDTGVVLVGAPANTIGGAVPGARNVISGNTKTGLNITGGAATGNQVQGNYIGTDVTGAAPLGNGFQGVQLGTTFMNTIGGTGAGTGNVIAFNGENGITIPDPFSLGNAFRRNSIFLNNKLGINLSGGMEDAFGVTSNDAGDGDTGANGLQNFPLLASVTSGGGNTIINGSLNSTANTIFQIDFYSNVSCDPSGHGEGETYIGTSAVGPTDINGNVVFNITLPIQVPGGRNITATATDPGDSTSEFSNCVGVVGPPAADALNDSAITDEDTPVTISVLANDSGTNATVTGATPPAHGSVSIVNSNTKIRYTPNPNFNGTDSFVYTMSSQEGTDSATVTVTVNPVNDPPQAVNDLALTTQGMAVTINVVSNDSDPDGDPLTVESVTQPPHGTVINNNNGTVKYTPNPNFGGIDVFSYTINDGQGGKDSAMVAVMVDPIVILQDDHNGNCVTVTAGTNTYTFKTATNGTFTGPAIISLSESTINFRSGVGDVNFLSGGMDVFRKTGSARLQAPRSIGPIFSVNDSFTDDSGPCP